MKIKVLQRLTSLSRVRKSYVVKCISNQKNTEVDRLKTDDLLLNDCPIDSQVKTQDVGFGERNATSINFGRLSTNDEPKLNFGPDVKKELTSISSSDNIPKLEINPINDAYEKASNESIPSLPENNKDEGIFSGLRERTNMKNQKYKTVETEVTQYSKKEPISNTTDDTNSGLFPTLEQPIDALPETGHGKFPSSSDTKPPSLNNPDYSYQDYINERHDIDASGDNRKRFPRRHGKQSEEDKQQNKSDLNKPEAKFHQGHSSTHSVTSLQTKKDDIRESSNILSSIHGTGLNFAPTLSKPKSLDVYALQTDFERKYTGLHRNNTVVNTKHYLQQPGQKLNQHINETTIKPGHLPMDPIDATQLGLRPSLREHPVSPVAQNDFLKLMTPSLSTSYDLVPGPSLLKVVGSVWKYIPILGTQCVSTLIHTIQSIASYIDKNADYPFMNPYYYFLNKYGPMVRLHKPLGADILLLAINGQDFPIVHIKRKESNYQSLFDSLNVYRNDAPSLNYMLDIPSRWSQLPDNPTLTVDQYYSSLEKITDDFIKEKRFIYGCNGTKDNDNHENDLIRWSLQCVLDVYFKSNKRCLAETDGIDSNNVMVDTLIKTTKCLRSCETGLQLWRAFTTITWSELTEYCNQMDRCILDEVNECLNLVSKGKPSGAAIESLLATEEIQVTDALTSLLDLIIINVNTVATTTGFLLYNLSKTPQVQRTLYREISNVVKKGSNISFEELGQLKYLNACITETLRMVPPFPLLKRILDEDTKIHRFQIPKGTYIHMVNILPYARGDNNCSKINKFQAERWTEATLMAGDPLAGLPQWDSFPKFNRDLVMTQIALLVTKVVREYRMEYPQNEVQPNGMVLQGPSSPFNFTFIERQI